MNEKPLMALEERYDRLEIGVARQMNAALRAETPGAVTLEPELDLFLMAECVEHCKKLCEWVRENGLVRQVEEQGLSCVVVKLLNKAVETNALPDVFPELQIEIEEFDTSPEKMQEWVRQDQLATAYRQGVESWGNGEARECPYMDEELAEMWEKGYDDGVSH